jgi:hypothetical protein
MVMIEAGLWKTSAASRESNVPTDDQDRHRAEPIPSDSTSKPAPATAKPDRATHQASRRTELDRIRLIDITRRQLLGYFCLGNPETASVTEWIDRKDQLACRIAGGKLSLRDALRL